MQENALFGGDDWRAVFARAGVFNNLCNIRQTFTALRTAAAALEDVGDATGLAAGRSEFFVTESVADADIQRTASTRFQMQLAHPMQSYIG